MVGVDSSIKVEVNGICVCLRRKAKGVNSRTEVTDCQMQTFWEKLNTERLASKCTCFVCVCVEGWGGVCFPDVVHVIHTCFYFDMHAKILNQTRKAKIRERGRERRHKHIFVYPILLLSLFIDRFQQWGVTVTGFFCCCLFWLVCFSLHSTYIFLLKTNWHKSLHNYQPSL